MSTYTVDQCVVFSFITMNGAEMFKEIVHVKTYAAAKKALGEWYEKNKEVAKACTRKWLVDGNHEDDSVLSPQVWMAPTSWMYKLEAELDKILG